MAAECPCLEKVASFAFATWIFWFVAVIALAGLVVSGRRRDVELYTKLLRAVRETIEQTVATQMGPRPASPPPEYYDPDSIEMRVINVQDRERRHRGQSLPDLPAPVHPVRR
ncbi:hypothetical protein BU24DRAFT_409942 [Aaosphaeria arxii CBS 175.79]|uniref:Uncharacterized protein n=1 Tax=Aaosphaeria arxii CBS 175.79 TaxID=1450172 RepID=A0A6A5XMV2_9PLEO|nr:uncharacterized protein BU24DRAFT_409942 [Aaosphaeria arxii CBS 175.79]KAF2014177.1 hypothetical protein BU24DRAFT_409942 [Aaosphaeria arxii CBS 175.79]